MNILNSNGMKKARTIGVVKTNIGRQPVQSKLGTGLNSSQKPYATAAIIPAVPSPLARRPTGRK